MKIPTATDRTDRVLTLAQTKAAAYADAGAMETAYRTLLKGAQSAQRANARSAPMNTATSIFSRPITQALLIALASAGSAIATQKVAKQRATKTVIIPSTAADHPATDGNRVR